MINSFRFIGAMDMGDRCWLWVTVVGMPRLGPTSPGTVEEQFFAEQRCNLIFGSIGFSTKSKHANAGVKASGLIRNG